MRILLTGRNGQVGTVLVRALAPLGEVRATGRAELDVEDPDAIVAAVRGLRPGLIVNAAAYTAADGAEAHPDVALSVNAHAPRVLAEEAARVGAALIHYSSDHVFDGKKEGPYVEEDVTAPLNVYGRTKLLGEQGVR
ncbi:MAG: SDR family oxidoreductase, partial [Gemmatimonadota bacterium]